MDNLYKNRLILLASALKSGKYKQNKKYTGLKTDDGFSVNGVATDLYREITGNGHWNDNAFYDVDGTWSNSISDKVGSFFLNDPSSPNISVGGQNLSFMHNNGKTFKEIAEVIERYVNE